MIKALKLGIEGSYLNIINIYAKPTANVTMNEEN
jgi:hypothetical protein